MKKKTQEMQTYFRLPLGGGILMPQNTSQKAGNDDATGKNHSYWKKKANNTKSQEMACSHLPKLWGLTLAILVFVCLGALWHRVKLSEFSGSGEGISNWNIDSLSYSARAVPM